MLIASQSFGEISVGVLTKKTAKEKYGITVHAQNDGDAGIKVWLEFKKDSYCTHCDSIRHFDDHESRLRIHHPDGSDEALAAMANLRKIGLAILDYHNKHNQLPTTANER